MRRFLHFAFLSTLILLTGLTLESCSRRDTANDMGGVASPATITVAAKVGGQSCFTGVFLNRSQMVNQCNLAMVSFPLTQANSYAVVNHQWLSTCIPAFQQELFDHGIQVSSVSGRTGWSSTFNCVQLANAFKTFAGERYHADSRFAVDPPPFLAICTVTYLRDSDARYAASLPSKPAPELHQILFVVTDHGGQFFDPQIGITTLTFTELLSISFKQA